MHHTLKNQLNAIVIIKVLKDLHISVSVCVCVVEMGPEVLQNLVGIACRRHIFSSASFASCFVCDDAVHYILLFAFV